MARKWLEDVRISIGPISFSPVSEKGRRLAELKRRIDVLSADYIDKLDESTALLNASSDILEAAIRRNGITSEERVRSNELSNKGKRLSAQADRLKDQIEDAVREIRML